MKHKLENELDKSLLLVIKVDKYINNIRTFYKNNKRILTNTLILGITLLAVIL